MRVRCAATLSVVAAVVIGACSSESGVSLDQEVDQVRTRIASCLVIEQDDGHRHNVTVEIYNQSESTWDVTVSLGAEGDLTGTSETIEVPAGGSDAFPVVFDQVTSDPVGEVDCEGFITQVETTLDP